MSRRPKRNRSLEDRAPGRRKQASADATDCGRAPSESLRHHSLASGTNSRTQDFRWALAICVFLLLAVALVFGQTIGHDFVNFDDEEYVYGNPRLSRGLTAEAVGWAFTTSHANNWHPFTWLSHILDCQLYGLHAGGHHLTNILLHAATAILLFLLLRRMTGDFWPSALVAAVFAVHPLRVESVAWVSERKDVLSGLFFMLTLAAYVGYVRHPFSLVRYLSVVALFALGLMAKPMLVTLPCVLLLLDYWPLGRWRPSTTWRLLFEKVPLLVLVAASCVVTPLAQADAVQPLEVVSTYARVSNALVSYVAYLGQLFYPAGLAVFYPYPEGSLPIWKVTGAFVVLAGISAGAVLWRRRFPYLFVGWFWYVGMLVPVIGLVQIGVQALADRYTYLPQIGLCVALAWGAADVVASWPAGRRVCGVGSVLAVLVLMGCAWRQTSYWCDSETLWTRALDCTVRNDIAHNHLGAALNKRGQIDAAILHFRAALAIMPNYLEAHNNLGVALQHCGRSDEAIAEFQKAAKLNPNHVSSHINLGNVWAARGQVNAAIAEYRSALVIEPDSVDAHGNLGNVLIRRGEVDAALAHYRRALELDPDYVDVHNNLGIALADQGQLEAAIEHYRRALAIKPDYADAHFNLGSALEQQDKTAEAVAHWREAVRLLPRHVAVLNQLAWVLATCPDASVRNGAEAVELAQRAETLSDGREPAVLGTLAAAYAEVGRFAEAVETAQRGAALATARGNAALADVIRARLKLYQAGSPYRALRTAHGR